MRGLRGLGGVMIWCTGYKCTILPVRGLGID